MLFEGPLGRKIPHGARARATLAPEGAFPRGSPRGRAEKLIFVRRAFSLGNPRGLAARGVPRGGGKLHGTRRPRFWRVSLPGALARQFPVFRAWAPWRLRSGSAFPEVCRLRRVLAFLAGRNHKRF